VYLLHEVLTLTPDLVLLILINVNIFNLFTVNLLGIVRRNHVYLLHEALTLTPDLVLLILTNVNIFNLFTVNFLGIVRGGALDNLFGFYTIKAF